MDIKKIFLSSSLDSAKQSSSLQLPVTSLALKTDPDGRVLSLIEFQQSQLEEVTKSVEILKNCNGELKEGMKILVSEIKDLKNQLKVEREYTRGLLLKEAAAAYKDLLLLSLDEREKGHMDKTTNFVYELLHKDKEKRDKPKKTLEERMSKIELIVHSKIWDKMFNGRGKKKVQSRNTHYLPQNTFTLTEKKKKKGADQSSEATPSQKQPMVIEKSK